MSLDWKKTYIKDACEVFVDGNWIESKDQSTKGIRLVQTGNIGLGYFKDKEDKARFISEDTFHRLKCTEILPGDLLVSRLPDPIGKSCIIPNINSKMITGVDCTIIRPKDNLLSEFLCYYQMSHQYLKDIELGVSGATRQRISRKNLGLIRIPLPTISEQRHIVSILDKAFVAINKVKSNAEENLKNAKLLFESLMLKIFIEGINIKKWDLEKLEKYSKVVVGYVGPISKEYTIDEEGILLLSTKNISAKGLTLEKLTRINHEFHYKNKKSQLAPGDILVARHGNSGQSIVIPNNIKHAHALNVIVIKRSETLSSEYTCYLLNSGVLNKITSSKGGSVQEIINTSVIKDLIIPVPSANEQNKIVNQLDLLSVETKKLEDIYTQKINDLEELKKSILQKAFSGELKEHSNVIA